MVRVERKEVCHTNGGTLCQRGSFGAETPHAVAILDAFPCAAGHALLLQHLRLEAAQGPPPLHVAALAGHADMVRELVRAGAALDLQDKQQRTALMKAARNGHTEVVEALLRAPKVAVAADPRPRRRDERSLREPSRNRASGPREAGERAAREVAATLGAALAWLRSGPQQWCGHRPVPPVV